MNKIYDYYVNFHYFSDEKFITVNDFKLKGNATTYACLSGVNIHTFREYKYMYYILPINTDIKQNQGIIFNEKELKFIGNNGTVKFKVLKTLTEEESKEFFKYTESKYHPHNYEKHIILRIDLKQFVSFSDFFLRMHFFRFIFEGAGRIYYRDSYDTYKSIKGRSKIAFTDVLLYTCLFINKYKEHKYYGNCHSSLLNMSPDKKIFIPNLFKSKEYLDFIKNKNNSVINNYFYNTFFCNKKIISTTFKEFNDLRLKEYNKKIKQ